MPHSIAHSVASTADASSVSPVPFPRSSHGWLTDSYYSPSTRSTTGLSPALASFNNAHPIEGPPSEWLYAGVSRRSDSRELKDTIAGWDKEWASLVGKGGKE